MTSSRASSNHRPRQFVAPPNSTHERVRGTRQKARRLLNDQSINRYFSELVLENSEDMKRKRRYLLEEDNRARRRFSPISGLISLIVVYTRRNSGRLGVAAIFIGGFCETLLLCLVQATLATPLHYPGLKLTFSSNQTKIKVTLSHTSICSHHFRLQRKTSVLQFNQQLCAWPT